MIMYLRKYIRYEESLGALRYTVTRKYLDTRAETLLPIIRLTTRKMRGEN